MKIDTYYDITCCRCARSRSTDFEKGMHHNKTALRKFAKAEGWGRDRETNNPICPDCMKGRTNIGPVQI